MLLRESGRISGVEVEADGLLGTPPIPQADRLAAFADAVGKDDAALLASARRGLLEAMGSAALVEASAVIAAFHCLDRIADATGIRMDPGLDMATAGLRGDMRLDRFASAANSPMSGLRRRFAKWMDPLTRMVLRWKAGR